MVDKLVAEEDPGQNGRTSMYKGLGRSRVEEYWACCSGR